MVIAMAKLVVALLAAGVQAQVNFISNLTSTPHSGTVYLVRHGEKDHKGCESDKGMARANNLYDVFNSKFEVPGYVYAWRYHSGTCQRCDQTAKPIASKIGMSPDTHHGASDCHQRCGDCHGFTDAVKQQLSSHSVVLVVAEHEHIQWITCDLGVSHSKIPNWPGSDFDAVYKVKYTSNGVEFSISKQNFNPSDDRRRRSSDDRRRRSSPTPIPTPTPTPSPSAGDTLTSGGQLHGGDHLVSSDGNVRLEMQTDGNLVIYHGSKTASKAVWSSKSNGNSGSRLVFQDDGNLVMYDQNGSAGWNSGRHSGATKAIIQNDCDLVTTDDSGSVLWSLGTQCSSETIV